MRILIADDNAAIRSCIGDLLSENSWDVCGEACNGAEAVEKARRLRPDLILLDVSMPGADGMQIAGILRRDVPQTKIVIVSHHDLGNMLPETDKALAHGFVDKVRMATDLPPTIRRLFPLTRTAP